MPWQARTVNDHGSPFARCAVVDEDVFEQGRNRLTYAELAPPSGLSGAPLALTAESTVRLQTDPDQGDDPATKAGAIVIPHHGEGHGYGRQWSSY